LSGESVEAVLRKVFVNREDELRSGWRLAAFVVCLYVLILLISAIAGLAAVLVPSLRSIIEPPPGGEHPGRAIVQFIVQSAVSLSSAIVATWICARALEHRSLGSVGFKLNRGWWRLFVVGSLLGAGTLGLAIAAEAATGGVAFRPQGHRPGQLVSSFVSLFLAFLMAAAFEELAFRGFAFQALVHNTGPVVAVLVMSVVFGLAHLGNPNPTLISTTNTILAGIWLSVAYLVTRNLWLSTALHYSWNLGMVYLFGLPVSGISTFDSLGLLAGQDKPPVWISGGDYGPEGGLAASVVLIVSTLFIWRSGWFKVSAEMAEAIKHGTPEPRYISIVDTNE